MTLRHKLGLVALAVSVTAACGSSGDDDGKGGSGGSGGSFNPVGPVANDASEAWPEKPNAPKLTVQQVVDACLAWTACKLQEPAANADPVLSMQLCVSAIEWSGERAVPLTDNISPFGDADERAEFWVQCALDNAQSCSDLDACVTPREVEMTCQEDGCHADVDYTVSCDGDIATLTPPDGPTATRDCSRAFAKCSTESLTGCTDRHFTACPEPPPQPDVCDGEIRLGCDGKQQVSYRDCSALGGTCSDGDCAYAVGDPCELPSCDGENLTVCFAMGAVTVPAPGVCPSN